MLVQLRPAIVLLALFTLLTGVVYPLVVTGVAQVVFPHQANGSLIEKDGKVIGSELIGQSFTSEKYFHGRPSATTDVDPNDASKTISAPYNAASSTGSNLGPTSTSLAERVKGDVNKLSAENPGAPVPVDLATASGSGLDPHVSVAGAYFQVPRVARARKLTETALRLMIEAHVEHRWLGIFGEPVINVLDLNLALDAQKQG